MRGFWIGLSAAMALGCGGDFVARPTGAGGRGGHAGAAHASGGAGRASAGVGGGEGLSGGTGGTAAASAGGGGRLFSDGGQPDEAAGAGGEPAVNGHAGAPGDDAGEGGLPSSGGGNGGGPPPSDCACDAAHECVQGKCVFKPECDCKGLDVECSTLSAALAEAFACPIDVKCGSCADGELCTVPYDSTQDLSFNRHCVASAAWADPPQGCTPAAIVSPIYGEPPTCPQITGCNVPYAFCEDIQGIIRESSGVACPAATTNSQTMPSAFCGPQL
jgi:hypothetical protein